MIQCPRCASQKLRSAATHGFFEKVGSLCGLLPMRCKDCDARFVRPIWDALNSVYARCPSCYTQDLATWTPENYHTPASWRVLTALGARRIRCNRCRRNFVSFRPRRARGTAASLTFPSDR